MNIYIYIGEYMSYQQKILDKVGEVRFMHIRFALECSYAWFGLSPVAAEKYIRSLAAAELIILRPDGWITKNRLTKLSSTEVFPWEK